VNVRVDLHKFGQQDQVCLPNVLIRAFPILWVVDLVAVRLF
jgi:hypothetical protein